MASGRPSRRRQISAAAAGSSSVRNPGRAAAPRSPRSRSATGSGSGSTGRRDSPGTPRGSRLVARICTPGQRARSSSASSAAAPMTCSQLSRTRSRLRCAQCSTRRVVGSAAAVGPGLSRATREFSRRPRALRTAPGTASGWSRRASSTIQPVSGWAEAACSARRVLPEPPGPVRVMRRSRARSPRSEASSGSRPTNEVRRGRRFPRGASVRGASGWGYGGWEGAGWEGAGRTCPGRGASGRPDGAWACAA